MIFRRNKAFSADFTRLAWANLSAQSAEQIVLSAAPMVAVLILGATVAQTGAMQTILTLPFVLLAIPAGVLADRLRRKTLMAWAEGLRAGSLLLLVILIVAGQLNWITLTALGFISVCGTVMFSVAAPALVPALVASKYLVSANARIELARTSAFTVGPALGGFLVGGIGAGAAFGVATILSILAVRMLQGINEQVRPRQQHRRPVQEIKEGVAFIASHPLLAPIFLTQFIFSAGMFMILAVFVPHAVHGLGLSASSVGLVMAMLGGGLFFGAVLSGAVLSRISFGAAIGIGPFTGLAGSIFIAATAWVPSAPLAGLVAGFGFFLLGAGPILWVISTTTLRQSVTPAELLGRVSAINILTYGARPLGAGLGTVIGSQFGAEVSLMATVIIFALQAAVISISPAVRLSEQPSGPILTDGAHP